METLVHENMPHGAPLVRVIKRFAGSHRNKELALEVGQPVWIVRRANLVNQRGKWWIGYDARGRRGVFPEECIDVRDVDPEQLKRAAAGDTRKLLEARRQRQGSRSQSPPPKYARVVDYALRAGTFHIELQPSLTVSHASLTLPDASTQPLDTFAAGIIETSPREDADNHDEADALGTWTDTHISISRALADFAKQSSIDKSTLMELKIDDDRTRQSKVWRLSIFPFLKYPATIFGLSTSIRIWFSANAEARPLASVSMLGEANVRVQLKCLQDIDVFIEKAHLDLGIIPVIRDADVSTNDLHQLGTMMETSSLNLVSGQPIIIGKSSFCRVSKLDANFGHLALILRDSDGTVAGHAEVSLARLSRTPDRQEKLKLHTETTVGSVKSVAAILSAKIKPALDQEVSHAPPSPRRMSSPTKHKRSTPADFAQIEIASPSHSESEHNEGQAQRQRGRSPHIRPWRGESPASRNSRSPSRETRQRERPRASRQAHHEIQQQKNIEPRQSRRHQTSPQRHLNATASPSSPVSEPWSPHSTPLLESPAILSARGKKAKDTSPRSKNRSENLSLVQQAQQGLNELLAPPQANHNQDVHEPDLAWASREKPEHDFREGFQQDSTSVDPSLTAQVQLGLRQLLHNHVADWQTPSLSQIETHSHLAVDVQDSSSPSSSSSSSSPSSVSSSSSSPSSSSSSSSSSSDFSTILLHTDKPSSPAMLHSPASKSQDQNAKSPLPPKTSPAWSHQGPETNSPSVQKQQKPFKASPDRDDLERYEIALEDNPGRVADSLFEQDRIEAIQRGLNGCLRLSRHQLWQLVADAGMWDTVAKGLGALRDDSEIVLPLLDLGSLASLLHLESGSLAVRQLHRALLDLVRVESIETAFEQHERGDIEKAAAGFEIDSSLQQWRPLVAIPFNQWTADHIAMLFRACGAGERRDKPAASVSRGRVTGKYLLEREMQGSFCLEQELCNLGVLDSIVRQRLQYQISLLAKHVVSRTNQDLRNEISGTDKAVMGETIAARHATTRLDDPEGAWWASRAFGLRARKPIKRWSVSDISRLGKLLRFAPAILSRMEAYALDGRGFVDLTRDEMRYELGLSPHEVDVFDASRKLLLIPPQVLLGSSDYLQVRVLNQHESLWEAGGGPEGKLCLALHRVHTLILRPGPGLMQAVDFASRKLERRHLLPAARIWFRLLEYTPGVRGAAGDETKSFSDAGAASLTAVIRKHTIDTVGDRLRRWDPLHDLVQTRTGQLRGWRYLGTTSVERGCTDECARLDLAFNTAAFTSVLASKTKAGLDSQASDNDATSGVARLYRFCFLVQLGTLKSPDSEFELVSVPLSNGIDSRTEGPGTHMFTLSAPFQIEPSKPSLSKTATRRKLVRKPRRKSTLPGKKSSKKQIKPGSSQRKNLPTCVAARNEPLKVASPKVPKASRQSATHTRRLYRDDYKMEQIAKLEQTQRDMQATLKEALKHGRGQEDAQVSQLRTQAAYHLGELMGGQASKMSIHNSQIEAKRLPSALDTATVRIAKDSVSKSASSSISSSSSSSSFTFSSSSMSSSPCSSSSSSSSSPCSSSSSSSQSPRWDGSSDGEADNKITKKTSSNRQRDWTEEMTVAETQRKRNDSDDEIDDELAAQWANRVSAQFLPSSPQGKTLTYPLRASSITADRCLSKLKRAVCRIGAASCLTYLAMHDRRYEGWITGSNFETFVVNDLNHPELVSELPEVLAELQTTHGNLARAQNGETVLRHERLVFRWTNESEAYRRALVQRLWRRAYLEEMDLLVALEPEGSPRHQVLRELDEDLDEDELHLVLGSRPNVDILDVPLIRLLGRSFWTGLIARLQPRATAFLDCIRKADNGQKTDDASSVLLDVASFAEAVQASIGIRLKDADLEELQAASGGGEGLINCKAIVEAAQTRASVDTETVLLQLMAADVDASGIVDQEAMFTALCAGARGEGATRDHIDQARRLAADYGRNPGPFTLWMVSTLHLARERAIEAEFVRLGRWFARCELAQRNALFDKLLPGEDDVVSYQDAQSILKESGFTSSFWAELCASSGKYMKESEEWTSTSAANDASKEMLHVPAEQVHPDMLFDVALVLCSRFPETSSQEAARKSAQRAVHGARLWRGISKLGGLKAFLSALHEQDKACEGEVSLDSFCTALKSKSRQDEKLLKIALLQDCKEESATEVRYDRLPIAYESVLMDLLTDLRLEKVHFTTLGLERLRRGLRKYHAQSGRPPYDICLTHDATSTGTVSMHELSWELGKLGVPIRCEGPDADFLQRRFGFKNAPHGSSQADIDYEMLVLEVSLLDAKGDIAAEASAKKEFACQVLGRMLRGSGTYVGVLHFIDAEFPHCGLSMEAESCDESSLLSRLEKVFAKEPRPKLRRLAQALVESFSADSEHVESKKRALRFDLLVEAMDSAPLDESRHALWRMIEVASQKKINLYETFREVDGDLDGSLSLRMLNRALETVGVPTVSVGAVSLVDAMAQEDEVVVYEVFIERSEMYLARGSFESRLSAARLRAVLRRINASLLQQDQGKTARHAFVDLVSAMESGQTDSVLSDWDLFFVLRNHKVGIQTFAELQTALAELLQKDVEKQSLEITLEIWLGLMASLE